jgi:Kef-type K+ transport system membrane component KefB
MPDTGFENLFIVALVALLAPLAVTLVPALRLPSVVVEILAGIILGPDVLGVVHADVPVQVLAVIGLAFLLFSVGLELDVRTLRGTALRLSVVGYAISLVLGAGVGLLAAEAGWVSSPLLIALALSATSLGLVVPVLKDSGNIESTAARLTIAAATFADVAAILLLTLLFSEKATGVGARVVLLLTFVGVVAVVGAGLLVTERWESLTRVVQQLQDTTAEIRVRGAVALLLGFVLLAQLFGLEAILGALLAGVVVGAVDRDSSTHPRFRTKLDAIGFGFLIPVFFVSSGIRLDVAGLVSDPGALARMPLFLVALLVVRGAPALLYRRQVSAPQAVAAGLLQATSLPFLVTATMIGSDLGLISPVNAAALVGAGVISVLVFPPIALGLLKQRHAQAAPSISGDAFVAGSAGTRSGGD